MKETIIYVALIMMEFNDEAICNAFYKGYGAPLGYPTKCSMIIRYKDPRDLSYGTLDDHVMGKPLPRPKGMFDDF